MSQEFPTKISQDDLEKISAIDPSIARRVAKLIGEKTRANDNAENLEFANSALEEEIETHKETAETLEWAMDIYRKALEDEVTGFLRRGELYKKIGNYINGTLDLGPEKITDEDWLEILANPDNQKALANNNKYILLGDVSYLSFANKDGHSAGDTLLKFIGQQFKNQNIRGFRHGGDEMTAFMEKSPEEISADLESVLEKIQQDPKINIFSQYELQPNVDFGLASINDALEIYNQLLQIENCPKTMAALDTLKQFENVWIEIADKRAMINKGQTRIPMLMDLYVSDREKFDVVINYFRKGGYDITNPEIDKLLIEEKRMAIINPEMDKDSIRMNLVNKFIHTREESAVSGEILPSEREEDAEKWFKKEKAKLIWNLAKKDLAI